jgi:hypothetical protein
MSTATSVSTDTPEHVLEAVVEGINTGNVDLLLSLYEPEAAFATQPSPLDHVEGRPKSLTGSQNSTSRDHTGHSTWSPWRPRTG